MPMNRIAPCAAIAFSIACAPASPPTPSAPALPAVDPAVAAYVRSASQTLRRVSRHRDTVEWPMLEDSALLLVRGARELRDAYPVVHWMLQRVDHHSFLQAQRRGAGGIMLRERVGYLRVPFAPGAATVVADSLQHAIAVLQSRGACGWLVDLRMNGGGNVWPMLAGIGPLLGDSARIWSYAEGRLEPYGVYVAGASYNLTDSAPPQLITRVTVAPARPVPLTAPIAVTIDEGTGSSAEAILIALKSRPNVRVFGTPSAGASTSNSGFRLPDGANMVITTAVFADASGKLYGDRVEPDELVHSPIMGANVLEGDPVTRRALDWVMLRPECSGGAA